MDNRFIEIIRLIKNSRLKALKIVNEELINLYWNIGKHVSTKIEQSEWGDSVVTELSKYIQNNKPDLKGFSDKNIWRMKQFYDTYKDFPKLSTLLRDISWSQIIKFNCQINSYYRRNYKSYLIVDLIIFAKIITEQAH